jgi:site-specific recombinase
MATDQDALRTGVDAFTTAATLSERTDTFVALVRWTRAGSARGSWSRDGARLDALLDLLDEAAGQRRFHAAIDALLAETDGTNAFAHAGIPSERGFIAELSERVMNNVLPRPRNDQDLGHLIRQLFRNAADAGRLAGMPSHRLVRLTRALYPVDHPSAAAALRRSFANGFHLLATSVQAQGLSPKLRKRSRPSEPTDSPFYRIQDASEAVVSGWITCGAVDAEAQAWRRTCDECREELAEVNRRIEREGVSSHVVYGVEVIERCLSRMSAMVDVMTAPAGNASVEAVRRLIVAVATAVHHDRSVRHLIQWNTQLLQRRIVERSGRTGEHYVTASRAEYRQMWLAAAGGGLLTVGTAAIKTTLSGWHVPDFVHGLLYGLNYAISFLLLQRFHLVLATKQPAMTAAALATIVRERRGVDRANEIAEYAARIARSQLAAAMGNVIMVCLGAFAFVQLWVLTTGRPFMTESDATGIYAQLNPLASGTVFYAVLTGVILWLASVVGGWFDNFCAYHRLPLAIAQHPAGGVLGRARMARWGEKLSENASGWGTNISLGFMLGMTPAIGHFLGLPLDVRHVTLNSGILSLASTSLGQRWFGEGAFLLGVAGVGVMFVLNLSVSFFLALATAARAYHLRTSDHAELLRGLLGRLRRTPLDFVIPPRQTRAPAEATRDVQAV